MRMKKLEKTVEAFSNRINQQDERIEQLLKENMELKKMTSQTGLTQNEIDMIKTAVLAALNAIIPAIEAKRKTAAAQKNAPKNAPGKQPMMKKTKKTFAEVLVKSDKADPVEVLTESRVDPVKKGITNWRKMGKGALSVQFADNNKKEEFLKILPTLGLDYKKAPVKRPYVIRVHTVPLRVGIEQVRMAVMQVIKNEAVSIQLAPYKRRPDCQMAVIETNEKNFQEMKKLKHITINWQKCRVDTKPVLMQCKKCKLLGHTQNHCTGLDGRMRVIKADIQCLDCYSYNLKSSDAGRPASQLRKTDHPTGDAKCKTRRAHLKRYIAARKRPEEDDAPQDGVETEEHVDPTRAGGDEKTTPPFKFGLAKRSTENLDDSRGSYDEHMKLDECTKMSKQEDKKLAWYEEIDKDVADDDDLQRFPYCERCSANSNISREEGRCFHCGTEIPDKEEEFQWCSKCSTLKICEGCNYCSSTGCEFQFQSQSPYYCNKCLNEE